MLLVRCIHSIQLIQGLLSGRYVPDLLKLEELAKLEKRYADEEAKETAEGKGGDGDGKATEAGDGEDQEVREKVVLSLYDAT